MGLAVTKLYQHRGTAFDLRLRDGHAAEGRLESILTAKGQKVEVKTEPKYQATENIVVEFEQSDGRDGSKPSGIKATESEWWAIEFLPDRWLILLTATLREIARVEYTISGSMAMGDNGNRGVLVPLTSLIDPFILAPSQRMCATCRRDVRSAA
jgi:hypothetical protein